VNEPVGKKTDQLRRDGSRVVSDDSATFDKIAQAVNSAGDLVQDMVDQENEAPPFRVVAPVLVVPTNTLWQIDYDRDGKIVSEARIVSRSTRYIDHGWRAFAGIHPVFYRMSHLELVPLNYLPTAVAEWTGEKGFFRKYMESTNKNR
jgi:hypothetical protein